MGPLSGLLFRRAEPPWPVRGLVTCRELGWGAGAGDSGCCIQVRRRPGGRVWGRGVRRRARPLCWACSLLCWGRSSPSGLQAAVRRQVSEQEPGGKSSALSVFFKDTGPGHMNSVTACLSYEAVLLLAEPATDGISASAVCSHASLHRQGSEWHRSRPRRVPTDSRVSKMMMTPL